MTKLWAIWGEDHDYDYDSGSDWIAGVYSTEKAASEATDIEALLSGLIGKLR